MKKPGTLFLCATPIGNLGDVTPRLSQTLAAVDLVAAEDTSRTLQLLNYLRLRKKLLSYHEHNKETAGRRLIEHLEEGRNVAFLSDAGYPCLSDPGEALCAQAVAKGITVSPIPGPNAALCALIASGLAAAPFFFGGFLPKTKKHREEKLRMWRSRMETIVLYEAPHRLTALLTALLSEWGDRRVVLAREITKIHEEFFRGSVSESLLWLRDKPPRGEFTLVVEGAGQTAPPPVLPLARAKQLLALGQSKKDSARQAARESGGSARDIYQRLLAEEKNGEDTDDDRKILHNNSYLLPQR